ncbi:MAG TPA: alpha-amylase family glycosyl hydrolase, partial [Bacteroidales bacterium]|nr:alpha-amylase family glycosyl hydrolase [Bacteroidales bacterium]
MLFSILANVSIAQPQPLVEPPFWWTGMKTDELQLMAHGEGIARTYPRLLYPGVQMVKVSKAESMDYLFIDLEIHDEALPGKFTIDFLGDENILYSFDYELRERKKGSSGRTGFGPEDVIYLIMPDRFSNGDESNDNLPGMLEKADRNNPDGRHGGDIKGILDNLDYISDMGYTAVWLNPVLENNNPKYSYHGYAITDFYSLDPRIGTNAEYAGFVEKCHNNGLKVIMDMVFNHCGMGHWW